MAPEDYLVCEKDAKGPDPYNPLFWPNVVKSRRKLHELTTVGLPIVNTSVWPPGRHMLAPANDPHYPQCADRAEWSTMRAWWDTELSTPGMWYFQDLSLSDKAKPGQDIRFTGYLLYNGHRRSVGSVTIHVTYR